MPLKFYTSERTENLANRQTGGIHDISLQERIIHFLQSTSCRIDPYDGGVIPYNEIDEFSLNIKKAIELISKEDENWQFSSSQLDSYYQRGIAYGLNLLPPRVQVCADLKGMLDLAKLAENSNSNLIFEGD